MRRAFDLLPYRRAGCGDNAYLETSRPEQSVLENAVAPCGYEQEDFLLRMYLHTAELQAQISTEF